MMPEFVPYIMPMRRLASLMATISGAAAIAGCAASVEQRGHLPGPDKLAEIHAGSTTKDEVVKTLGTPSSVSVFNSDKSWYYISRRTAQTAFFDPAVLDQQVDLVLERPLGRLGSGGGRIEILDDHPLLFFWGPGEPMHAQLLAGQVNDRAEVPLDGED